MTADKKPKQSFNTIWLRFCASSSERHQLFLKEHSLRQQDSRYPKGRTLFVLNIPPYATAESLKRAFADSCGPVHAVYFADDASQGFKNGYVVFDKADGLRKSLALKADHTLVLSTEEQPLLTGMQKWFKAYNESIEDESVIKATVEKFMSEYDAQVAAEAEREKALTESKDGWTKVTGRKKRGQYAPSRKESTIEKMKGKEEEKKQKKQLLNFYSFQIREAKKQDLAELRKKFELDKKKLEQIKSKRKFKPF